MISERFGTLARLIKSFTNPQTLMYDICLFFRWVGVVGHTLYGDVDIGMCNIDITYTRYQVVDFSAWVR